MIEFFLGKTGGGKSYHALRRVVSELVSDDSCVVVTNLALNLDKLNAYLKKKYANLEPDVVGRVRLLSDDETREFYLYRHHGCQLPAVSKEEEQRMIFPAFGEAVKNAPRVLYVIDETHLFFDSREWAKVGLTLNFFASQHRKFKCDIVFITQFLDQVEKRLRQHATQFTECINYGLRRFALWSLPRMLQTRVTYKAPPCPSDYTATYRIDPELAACYDTTAGVKVAGGGKPEFVRQTGLPWWTAVILIGLVVWGGLQLPWLLGKGIAMMTKSTTEAAAAEITGKTAPLSAVPVQTPQPAANASKQAAIVIPEAPRVKVSPLRVVGYVAKGDNRILLTLSDGRKLSERDPSFGGVDPLGTGAWIDGQKVPMANVYIPPPKPKEDLRKEQEAEGVVSPYSGEAVVPDPESADRSKKAAERPQPQQDTQTVGGGRGRAAARPL